FDTFRQFITGMGVHAVFDLPWAPIYIAVIFALHPALGAFALGCSILLILMALLNEWIVKPPLTETGEASSRNYSFTEMSLRNTEVVRAMGMTDGLLRRWGRDRNRMLERQVAASDRAATMQSVIRFLRLSMQSVILGLGAYLVIERLATVGAMFAASILLGRALQPVDQIVGSWRTMVSARGAFLRVRELLSANPPREGGLSLPRPDGRLWVEALTFVPPLSNKPILRGVAFGIEPGEVLGVMGPSGSGKAPLGRHYLGLATAGYGNPSLVVIDEPSSNLDADGDAALTDCIMQLKQRGTTVVIISHRPSTIGVVDKILLLKDGVAEMFGPRAEVMSRLTR